MVKNCYCNLQNEKEFMKWIIELLGPVLLGVKPAEILSFPTNKSGVNESIETIQELFKTSHKLGYQAFYTPNGCMKVLFYNIQNLNNVLSEARNLKLLKKLGYPEDYELEQYLGFMIDKLKTGEMPHEIGTFLGYPLKDVLGFIGHPSLKLTKINGWRIYGDPRISDLKYQQILEAKQQIKHQLQSLDIHCILQTAC